MDDFPVTLWPRLAALPLHVEAIAFDRLDPGPGSHPDAHATRLVRLRGGGHEGQAEDITLFMSESPADLPLAGDWTLAAFCDHLATLDQWPEGPPEWDMALRWRNWAYESAALDLALRQAGRPLHDVLGEPPDAGTILRRLERYPDLRFKLDAAAAWTPEIVAALAGTGAVAIVDFKGQYGLEVEDAGALARMYALVVDAFPDALLEDPHDLPEVTALVAPHAARVSYDAPIATVADLDATPIPARTFNIKPTRVGSLEALLALYATCAERGLAVYGGGMGELGVARGQIQLLASLFSPGAPNDIAPPGFNAVEPAAGLPRSPLEPRAAPAGFRRLG